MSRGMSADVSKVGHHLLQQQVANAAVQSHFEITVRDPVKHGDNMSVSVLMTWQRGHTA